MRTHRRSSSGMARAARSTPPNGCGAAKRPSTCAYDTAGCTPKLRPNCTAVGDVAERSALGCSVRSESCVRGCTRRTLPVRGAARCAARRRSGRGTVRGAAQG
eukprot:5030086-Prymnesium_polylepis.1